MDRTPSPSVSMQRNQYSILEREMTDAESYRHIGLRCNILSRHTEPSCCFYLVGFFLSSSDMRNQTNSA